MRRRAPGEIVAPFRHRRDRPALTAVAGQLARWLGKHLDGLERAAPSMPLEDRAADTWEPLVAVADLAGGLWPVLARRAAVALAADQDAEARTSDGIRLLADLRAAFAALGNPDAATTKDLLRALNADPEAPWAALAPGGITAKRLADMLGDFEIRAAPEAIRFEVGRARGYTRQAFADAWRRYCPPAPPGVPVSSVPSVSSQLSPDTDYPPDTDQSVSDPGRDTDQSVSAIQSVSGLTSQNTDDTDCTDTPRAEALIAAAEDVIAAAHPTTAGAAGLPDTLTDAVCGLAEALADHTGTGPARELAAAARLVLAAALALPRTERPADPRIRAALTALRDALPATNGGAA